MNWADWVIIAIIVLSGLISLKRGFIKEALSLLIWVLAFVIARMFSANMSTLLVDYIDVPTVRYAAAFAILFAATSIRNCGLGARTSAATSPQLVTFVES